MQEDCEEPIYRKPVGKSSLIPGSQGNSSSSISDIRYREELSVGDYEDNSMYAPSQDNNHLTYSPKRSGTAYVDESMIKDMNYHYPKMDNVDLLTANNIRNTYRRNNPMPIDNSLYIDDLSPIPQDAGFTSRSGRHSPINRMNCECNIYGSHGDFGCERFSPVVPENYPNRMPRNMYRNDYYSDTNLSPLRCSPLPPNREMVPPKYYSPTPYDYCGDPRCLSPHCSPYRSPYRSPHYSPYRSPRHSPYRSPQLHPSEISGYPGYEDPRMLRNRSLLNMNEDYLFESDHSYRAKSLMYVSDYEDLQKDPIPPSLTPSLTPSHTPFHSHSITPDHSSTHTPSITPDHSSTHTPSITPDHISLSEEALSTENEEIVSSIQVETPDQSNESNLVDAIFASCTPTVPSNQETSTDIVKPAVKPTVKSKSKPRQTRSRLQPAQSKSKNKPKPKQANKHDNETTEDTKKSPCRDFENGVCSRGDACKYYHDPAKGKL